MKKILLITLAFTIFNSVNAQITTPQPSPFSKIEQKVGLTDITLEYSRPAMRGRTIFGDLVPFGKTWRTGANANTKITFSTDVTVSGQELKAGSYAVYTIPNIESWEVIFYSDASNWGTPQEWDDAKVSARTTVKTSALPFSIESFSIGINDLNNKGATINMYWANTFITVPFNVPTDKAVLASIEKTMAGPGAGDYFSAAVYYLQEDKDINQAKMWIDKAVSLTKDSERGTPFWFLRQQSLIYAAAGDKAGAIEAAKKSLAGAEKAGNADYVKMNKDSLAEWQK